MLLRHVHYCAVHPLDFILHLCNSSKILEFRHILNSLYSSVVTHVLFLACGMCHHSKHLRKYLLDLQSTSILMLPDPTRGLFSIFSLLSPPKLSQQTVVPSLLSSETSLFTLQLSFLRTYYRPSTLKLIEVEIEERLSEILIER